MTDYTHDLFYELDAWNPRWRQEYSTLQAAAIAADVHDMWKDWCRTQGQGTAGCECVHDYIAEVRSEQAARSAQLAMLNHYGHGRIPAGSFPRD